VAARWRAGKRKSRNRAGLALRLAAGTLRLRTRPGAPRAGKAMASRLARTSCRMLRHGDKYADKAREFYERKYHESEIRMVTPRGPRTGSATAAFCVTAAVGFGRACGARGVACPCYSAAAVFVATVRPRSASFTVNVARTAVEVASDAVRSRTSW